MKGGLSPPFLLSTIFINVRDLIQKILKENDLSNFSGWVNVKIDSEVNKRVERIMNGLGFRTGDLRLKINFLSDPVHGRVREGESIGQALNRKISAMILLQYLKEMKTLFNSQSAGFLFESFIAGLLGGEQILGTTAVDVVTNTEKYQIKLLGPTTKSIKQPTSKGDQPTKFILGIKNASSVDIYQLDYNVFLENVGRKRDKEGKFIDVSKFIGLSEKLGTLNLSNIEGMSDELQADLSGSVSSLWDTISELQFNVESMLTGITKGGEKTTSLKAANAAQNNTKELDRKIEEVRGFFKPRTLA